MKNRPKTNTGQFFNERRLSDTQLFEQLHPSTSTGGIGARHTKKTQSSRGKLIATKSAIVLKNYASLTLKPEGQLGEADSYFRKTLRNYDGLELLSPPGYRNKPKRAASAKPKKKLGLGQGDYKKHKKYCSISDTSLHTPRAPEDDETDVFYSPNSSYLYCSGDEHDTVQVHHIVKKPREYNNLVFESFEPDLIQIEEYLEKDEQAPVNVADEEKEKELFHSTEDLIDSDSSIKSSHSSIPAIIAMADEEGEAEVQLDEPGDAEASEKDDSAKDSKGDKGDENIPPDENSVLKEVEECEAQCMEIYKILNELKQRVTELLSKASRTPLEDQELEVKQKLLNDKMALLEQKTRRIELLVGKTKKPDFDKFYDEDTLPKVVVCGLAENNMPKFIICDDKKRRTGRKTTCSPITGPSKLCPNANLPQQPFQGPPPCGPPCQGRGQQQQQQQFQAPMMCGPPSQGGRQQQQQYQAPIMCGPPPQIAHPPQSMFPPQPCFPGNANQMNPQMAMMQNPVPHIAKRLSESYEMQERLARDNADLEGKRYQLQEVLINKENALESLQVQLQCMQKELRQVVKENGILNNKLQQIQVSKDFGGAMPSPPCGPRQGADKTCPPPARPCGPGKGPCPADDNEETKKLEKQLTLMELEVKAIQNELTTVRQERLHLEQHRRMLSPMTCPPPCVPPCMPPCPPRTDAQLRELREKYNCLQDDYKSKLMEVASLRADVDKFKVNLQEAIENKKMMEDKIKELDKLLKEVRDPKAGSYTKENFMELEQQLSVAKQRFRDAQDELDELRALTEEQQCQLNDYRNKYLDAQQQVEEQKRQMDLMELENSRIGEQVNLEIQRVKNQFQEKLQELTPLPDILKATQLKLQEAQQMHLMAERNNEALLREIQNLRDKAVLAVEQMEANKSGLGNLDAERQSLSDANEELGKQLQLLTAENDDLRKEMERMHDEVDDAEKRAQEKLHEIAQLSAEVENVRDESARQVARIKDRCETVRRSMQNQICDLEKQLAQSRAQAKSAQRDRDDIRQKMQSQINNLNENFEDAQMRIRTLQGHVNFLKNSASVYPSLDQLPPNRNC